MGVRTPQSKNVLDWRSNVQMALKDAYPELDWKEPMYPKGTPVSATVFIYVLKPKSNRDKSPVNQRTGDIDKYLRSIFDACTDYIYHDDSQVTVTFGSKEYVENEEEQGAVITMATGSKGFRPKDFYPPLTSQ